MNTLRSTRRSALRRGFGALAFAALATSTAAAQDVRVRVTFESLVPEQGNFFTPVFSAFHDGTFDIYDSGVPAFGPNAPVPNDALERLAEDGATGPLMAEFLATGAGTAVGTVPGPNGPIAPGDVTGADFLLDPHAPSSRYFSWASMVLPSNDAFIANGNPKELEVFDANGQFARGRSFEIGTGYLDAGTEVNDELPATTAFFGQAAPNTGADENGVVTLHPGFNAPGTGGILDDARYSESDFRATGYPGLKIRLEAAEARTDFQGFGAFISESESSIGGSSATGLALFLVTDEGTQVRSFVRLFGAEDVTSITLNRAAFGSDGPSVANVLNATATTGTPTPVPVGSGPFLPMAAIVASRDLEGPLNAFPLDALTAEAIASTLYLSVREADGSEIRGQLFKAL